MKKTIIIILALVLILVGGIWLYLLLFGAPQSADDLFADLGFGSSPTPTVTQTETPEPTPIDPVVDERPVVEITERLSLLSETPSIGSVIIGSTTNAQKVRFVEQGIGQVYEIDLTSGEETKISETIFEGISYGIWNKNGTRLILVKDAAVGREVTLYDLSETTSLPENGGVTLPPDAQNIAFTNIDTFNYTRSDDEGTLGYTYNANSGTAAVVFSVPFIAISVDWGVETVVYNKPSELHPGYAYIVKDNNYLESAANGGIGLTAFQTTENVVVNIRDTETGYYRGYVAHQGAADVALSIPLLPEKCVAGIEENIVWCGYPFGVFRGDMPNDWYKGKLSLTDDLWKVNISTGEAFLMDNLSESAKTDIDVVGMTTGLLGERFIFNDLNTYALWLYDTTKE